MKKSIPYLFAATILLGLASCSKTETDLPYKNANLQLPETPFTYQSHNSNLVTDRGATLGRVLFYDPIMSLNNKVACASCHHQENSFADPVALSTGFDGQKTTRNALAIVNLNPNHDFFWDKREDKLENMVLKPITNHVEMGLEDLDNLANKINGAAYYKDLFKSAYGDDNITNERIGDALQQFILSLSGRNSRFDREISLGNWGSTGTLSPEEALGRSVFIGKGRCSTCHDGTDLNQGTAFSSGGQWSTSTEANIGLEVEYADPGIGALKPGMTGHFKVPTLRNVALTAPYMHDGRFASLEDVIEHYSKGIQNHPNLDGRVKNADGSVWRGNFTEAEKAGLVAFLNMMTDEDLVTNEKFSNPFK